MEQPTSIKFAGLEINVKDLNLGPPRGPMCRDWTRVQFVIPDAYDVPDKVRNWLVSHAMNDWSCYTYSDPKTNDFQMVIRFADRNDALMFKLKGGHQIWEA